MSAAIIDGFFDQSADVTKEMDMDMHVAARESVAHVANDQAFVAPRDGVSGACLELAPGASQVRIVGDPALAALCRAQFMGERPRAQAVAGIVSISYPRHSIFDWLKEAVVGDERAARVVLNGDVLWRIAIAGGASRISAELRRARLEGLRIAGGASQVDLALPHPAGIVPIRIGGGASEVTIRRPRGVAARLTVQGGVSMLTADDHQAGAAGGRFRWQSPDFASAASGYEVEIAGGASGLTIIME